MRRSPASRLKTVVVHECLTCSENDTSNGGEEKSMETQDKESTAGVESLLRQQLDAERLRLKSVEEELQAERLKTHGMRMLFDCMQEEHCENRRLKNILRQRKHSLRKLRKRLQSDPNVAVVGQINWDELSDFSEIEEPAERGTQNLLSAQESKEDQLRSQTLESLSHSLNGGGGSTEPLQRHIEQLTREKEQLVAQLRSSGSEKDSEILTLRTQLSDAEQSYKASGVLCDALLEEAVVLKRHLTGTAEMCQKLVRTLEMKRGFVRKITNCSLSADKVNDAGAANVPTLQQQYNNLERQLKEVVTMNSRWQQYNEQREEYVQQLLQRNVELEQAVVNRGQQLSLGQQERIDQILMDQKQKLEVAQEETAALKTENQGLRNRLQSMQDEHNRAVQKLREQYAHEAAKSRKAVLLQHSENVEALKLQMQMYREDFESERRDRERAQDHIERLEAQIRSATQQLNLNRITTNPEQTRASDPALYQPFPLEASLVGRGAVSFVAEDRSDCGEPDRRSLD